MANAQSGTLILVVWVLASGAAWAGSVLELLSDYDQRSVAATARWLAAPQDTEAIRDAARLQYQVKRIDQSLLRARASRSPHGTEWIPGDVIQIDGRVTGIAAVSVPDPQAEVLEMPRLFRLELQADPPLRAASADSAASQPAGDEQAIRCFVMTDAVPRSWLAPPTRLETRRVQVVGVVVQVDQGNQPSFIASTIVQWYPDESETVLNEGWRLLSELRFDCSHWDEVQERDKRGLSATEPFFELLAAAGRAVSTATPPQPVQVIDLLERSREMVGRWIRLRAETVRVTQIFLDAESSAAQTLGQEHYWQIDAFARLDGRVVIDTEQPGQPVSQPVEFDGRYPVSLVVAELPRELSDALETQGGMQAVVGMIRRPIAIDGFYFRQWSYDSEYMQARGAGRQFGPLVMVSRLTVLQPGQIRSRVNWQSVVATVFLSGLVLVILVSWYLGRHDRQAVLQRRQRELEMDDKFSQST